MSSAVGSSYPSREGSCEMIVAALCERRLMPLNQKGFRGQGAY
jgi:hypothetical protein